MAKSKNINRWLWKWHIIGGLIVLPFMLMLSITGIIYLFKTDYNQMAYSDTLLVMVPEEGVQKYSYNKQLAVVKETTEHRVTEVSLPTEDNQATGFRVHGKGHAKKMIYVDPYKGEVTGQINQNETGMHTVRKLHGELLLSKAGTLTIELVASWFVVLALTGIYIWWPAKRFSLAGFFTIRIKQGSRTFWRDMHSVVAFWLSIFLLIIVAGGMPWTDVFGGQLKWVQKNTDSGYPSTWRSSKGLESEISGDALNLDQMVAIAQAQNLKGQLTIKLPQNEGSVFTLTNRSFWLDDQEVKHFDQYSGKEVKSHTWNDVGFLMNLRQITMRLHQGEYGTISWFAVMLIAGLFVVSIVAGLTSYLKRKPEGRFGLPEVPEQFQVGKVLLIIIIALGVVFPMFGASVLLIALGEFVYKRANKLLKR